MSRTENLMVPFFKDTKRMFAYLCKLCISCKNVSTMKNTILNFLSIGYRDTGAVLHFMGVGTQ